MRVFDDVYFEMSYLIMAIRVEGGFLQSTTAGGSGTRRIWLSEIPGWLLSNPGAMILSLREV